MPYPFSTFLASSLLLASATSVVAEPAWVGTACDSNIDCRDFNCDMSAYTEDGCLPFDVDGNLGNSGDSSEIGSYRCVDKCSTNTEFYDLFVSCSGRCVHGKCQEGFRCSSHGEPNCNDVCDLDDVCKPSEGGSASLCEATCQAKTVCISLDNADCANYPGGICDLSTETGTCQERVQCELNTQTDCKETDGCWWFENPCDDTNDGKACYKAPADHQCEVVDDKDDCRFMGCKWEDADCGDFKTPGKCNDNLCQWRGKNYCKDYPEKEDCKAAGCKWHRQKCKKKCSGTPTPTGKCSGRWESM